MSFTKIFVEKNVIFITFFPKLPENDEGKKLFLPLKSTPKKAKAKNNFHFHLVKILSSFAFLLD